MTIVRRLFSALVIAALGTTSVYAHPLHGAGASFASGLAHPFAGLDHLLAAVAVGLWAAHLGGRATWIVPSAFVTVMLVGSAAAIAGFGAGAFEAMIAFSIAAMGLILVLRYRWHVLLATSLVACFGLFHGMAHVENLGGAAAPFLAGLFCATALLHACGVWAARKIPVIVPVAGAALAGVGVWWMAASVL